MKDIVIIGSGISGSSLARELSKYNLNILVLEKENDTANGASKANSGISHGGYDPLPGTLMAKYNIIGNRMMPKLCEDLSVPYNKSGVLVLAFNDKDLEMIQVLYNRGIENGVPVEESAILSREEVLLREPNISKEVKGAYWCGTTAVIGSFELCVAMLENAVMNGVEVYFNTEVINIKKKTENFTIYTNNPDYPIIETRFVVNAAGVFADKIHNMIAEKGYSIKVRRGEYFLLTKLSGQMVNSVLFPCPNENGKGVLVARTAHGNLIVGPNSEYTDRKENVDTTIMGLDEVKKMSQKLIPDIPFSSNLRNFSGNRAEASTGDFIIGEVKDVRGFYEIAGIKSPGLTSAPAIAVDMVKMLQKGGLGLVPKDSYNPKRIVIHLDYLSWEEKAHLIASNPAYGRIICRCENISEGEIVDAIKRPIGGRSLEGIKKRTRVCAGQCQGSFCIPLILAIVTKQLNIKPELINQDKNGSYIVLGKTPKGENYDL